MLHDDLIKIFVQRPSPKIGADRVLELLTPELEKARLWDDTIRAVPENWEEMKEKARLWDRVKEVAKNCGRCPVVCDADGCQQCYPQLLVDALEKEPCPYPIPGDDGTAKDCVTKGHCGCGEEEKS